MKRSSQVALLLMGVTGVGASSYALAPRRDCPPPRVPGAAAPGAREFVAQAPACQPGRSYFTSHGSRGYWSRPIFSSGAFESTRTVTSTATGPSSGSGPSTGRGGFGSTGHGISSGS